MPRKRRSSSRPYRLWNSEEKRFEPHRAYSHIKRAHMAANDIVSWKNPNTDVGFTLEVLDVSDHERWKGTYKRTTSGVAIERVKLKPEENI